MDYTRLDREYSSYWFNNDLQKAIKNLKEIDFYLSEGNYNTWLNSYENLLKPPYLVGLYNQLNGTSFQIIQNNISYIQLLENFRDYVSKLIAESQLIDEQSKLQLEEINNDWFSNIAKAFEGLTKSASNVLELLPFILIGGIAVYFVVKTLKD